MGEPIAKLAKVVSGAALGYGAYCAVVLGSVILKAARLHYFDKEALLAGAMSPIGALGSLVIGDWNYPLWIWLRDLLAYALIAGGVALAVRWRRARPK